MSPVVINEFEVVAETEPMAAPDASAMPAAPDPAHLDEALERAAQQRAARARRLHAD